MTAEKKALVTQSVRLPQWLWDELSSMADDRCLDRSALIRTLLNDQAKLYTNAVRERAVTAYATKRDTASGDHADN